MSCLASDGEPCSCSCSCCCYWRRRRGRQRSMMFQHEWRCCDVVCYHLLMAELGWGCRQTRQPCGGCRCGRHSDCLRYVGVSSPFPSIRLTSSLMTIHDDDSDQYNTVLYLSFVRCLRDPLFFGTV